MESSSQARRLPREAGHLVPGDSHLACNTQLSSTQSFTPGLADVSFTPHRPAFGERGEGPGGDPRRRSTLLCLEGSTPVGQVRMRAVEGR